MTIGWLTILVAQAVIALGVISVYVGAGGKPLSGFLGLMAPHGFAQGPGQAVAIGAQWESEFGIDLTVNFGLIYASVGFFASFLVGVPAARWAIRRGLNANVLARLDEVYLRGMHLRDQRPLMGHHVTHSANVDSLAYHLGLLGVAYLLTDQYLRLMQPLTADLAPGGIPTGLIFSHNYFFLHGMLVCLAMRDLLDRLGYGHVIDGDTKKRITGTAVDFMLICSILSVQFGLLSEFFVPILLITGAVVATTADLCFLFSRSLSRLQPERAIALFSVGVGTTGSGFLLLRMLDPNLSTSVARELAFFAIAVTFVGTHILYVMVPVLPSFSIGTIVAVFYGAHMVLGAALWLARRA
jgi:ESS family glutamate:Na+ symporter